MWDRSWDEFRDEFHVVFQTPHGIGCILVGAFSAPTRMHANLFAGFGGWSSLGPAALPGNAMRLFMAQDARVYTIAELLFINACVLRSQKSPPDEVMFGDPCKSNRRVVADCDDELCELFNLIDCNLEPNGFIAVTP